MAHYRARRASLPPAQLPLPGNSTSLGSAAVLPAQTTPPSRPGSGKTTEQSRTMAEACGPAPTDATLSPTPGKTGKAPDRAVPVRARARRLTGSVRKTSSFRKPQGIWNLPLAHARTLKQQSVSVCRSRDREGAVGWGQTAIGSPCPSITYRIAATTRSRPEIRLRAPMPRPASAPLPAKLVQTAAGVCLTEVVHDLVGSCFGRYARHDMYVSRSHVASVEDPAPMVTNFRDRLQDDVPRARIKVIRRLYHKRPFGLSGGVRPGRGGPGTGLIM